MKKSIQSLNINQNLFPNKVENQAKKSSILSGSSQSLRNSYHYSPN